VISPAVWTPADGLKLEPNALEAAMETRQSIALTAGPGAGKTEMLAQRADFLLRTGGCRYPRRILAISFKVDASASLRERVRRRCGLELASRFDSHTFHAFGKRLIDRFRPVLTGADQLNPDYTVGEHRIQGSAIEFRDLVLLALRVLTVSAYARNAIRQTYSHVFLDEFQDCNSDQYELICRAFHGTNTLLTAVGDTKQRIMAWAGALEGIFGRFALDFNARGLNLYQNFRSLPRLRRMQNAMVKIMDPQAAVPDAELAGDGGEIITLDFPDDAQEAAAVAQEIHGWIAIDETQPAQIAVLVSKQLEQYAAPLMRELSARAIPFRNDHEIQDLASEPAAGLVVDLLRVVCGEREPDAYSRLMGVIVSGDLDEDSAYNDRATWNSLLDSAREQFQALSGSLAQRLNEAVRPLVSFLGPTRAAGLSAEYEHGGRFADLVSQTLSRIAEFASLYGGEVLVALRRFMGEDAVRILTIHKSKGLEFDTVVILGVEAETFWGKADEERSAYFVGISRAKRRLVLTTAARRARPEGFQRRWNEVRHPHEEFLGYAASTK